jgi:hypothetical protein
MSIEQIRRSHASARPKADNPAWMNTHHDLTVVLDSHDKLYRALSNAHYRVRYLLQFADGDREAVERELKAWDEVLDAAEGSP